MSPGVPSPEVPPKVAGRPRTVLGTGSTRRRDHRRDVTDCTTVVDETCRTTTVVLHPISPKSYRRIVTFVRDLSPLVPRFRIRKHLSTGTLLRQGEPEGKGVHTFLLLLLISLIPHYTLNLFHYILFVTRTGVYFCIILERNLLSLLSFPKELTKRRRKPVAQFIKWQRRDPHVRGSTTFTQNSDLKDKEPHTFQ